MTYTLDEAVNAMLATRQDWFNGISQAELRGVMEMQLTAQVKLRPKHLLDKIKGAFDVFGDVER